MSAPLPSFALSVLLTNILVIDHGGLRSANDVICKFFGSSLEQVPPAT